VARKHVAKKLKVTETTSQEVSSSSRIVEYLSLNVVYADNKIPLLAGDVVWTSLGPLPRWVPGPTTRWAPGTTRLVPHSTCWHEAQGPRRRSTLIGSYTYHVQCRGLLDVHD
jgi:hypothetical protein